VDDASAAVAGVDRREGFEGREGFVDDAFMDRV
jgi:hypothetical protein